jgi:hypothetical protein
VRRWTTPKNDFAKIGTVSPNVMRPIVRKLDMLLGTQIVALLLAFSTTSVGSPRHSSSD